MENNKNIIIQSLKDTIVDFESKLLRYKRFVEENPDSIFYRGLVKNTKETIQELKDNLKQLESELKK